MSLRSTFLVKTFASVLGIALLSGTLTSCGGGGGVGGVPGLVTLVTASIPPGTTGVAYTQQFDAVFPHSPGKFLVTGGTLPPGLSLDRQTGLLTGFPRQVGTFAFEIAARDGTDTSLPPGRDSTYAESRREFTVVVALGAPHIIPQDIPAAQYRNPYSYQIDVAGGQAPLTFAQTGGTLPTGLSVSSAGVISAFPTSAAQHFWDFDVTVTDAHGLQDTATLTLELVVLPLVILTSSPLPAGAQDFPYDVVLTLASAGAGSPYAWSQNPPIAGETLLSTIGMEVSNDGHVRNDVSHVGPSAPGTFLFTVKVTDESNQLATRQYSMKINPGPVLSDINPKKGSVPGPFTATGLNFQSGATLTFKPGPQQVVLTPTFVSPTKLTFANAPPPPATGGGFVDVKVTNPDGGSFTLVGGFAFPAGTISFNTTPVLPSPQSGLSSTGLAVGDINKDGFADFVHCGTGNTGGSWGYDASTGNSKVGTTKGLDVMMNAPAAGVFNGTFTKFSLDTANDWYQVKLADIDSDGDLDIVGVGRIGGIGMIRVYRNNSATFPAPGSFTVHDTALAYETPPYGNNSFGHVSDASLGRLNTGDSLLDLVYVGQNGQVQYTGYSSFAGGSISSQQGNGNGTFSSAAIDGGKTVQGVYAAAGVATGNFNGDGQSDVFVTDQYAGYVQFQFGGAIPGGSYAMTTGTQGFFGNFTPQARPGATGMTEILGVTVSDFTGDGKDDVAIAAGRIEAFNGFGGTSGLSVFQGSGTGTFSSLTTTAPTPPIPSYRYVTPIDADFDTTMDIALSAGLGSAPHNRIDVYKGRTGAAGPQWKVSLNLTAAGSSNVGRIGSGDFNRDGRDDIAVCMSFFADNWQYLGTAAYDRGDGSTKGVAIYLNTSN